MVIENDKNPKLGQCLLLSRLLFFVGMGLTVAGGALEGSDNNSDALTGVKLVKAGYFLVLVFLICLLVVQGYFWQQSPRLSRTARTVRYLTIGLIHYVLTVDLQALKAMALATPFMVVRITFLFLAVFDSSDLRWSALYGPIAPFLTMGLLMEYSVVCIYLTTGFIVSPWKRARL